MKRAMQYLVMLTAAWGMFGVSCSTTMRDALLTGAIDFVSGTTTDSLTKLLGTEAWFAE